MISEIPGFVVEGRQVLTFGINPRQLWIFFSALISGKWSIKYFQD